MTNPHLLTPAVFRGTDAAEARGAVVLIHGRRQTIDDIYECADRISLSNMRYAMPVADELTWYPRGFMRPIEDNEPRLGYALAAVNEAVGSLIDQGFRREAIVLMGFSQGACLACEYVYRNPARWGGLISFTGGLFGPPGMNWHVDSSLQQTPVFLGIGDPDEWIPGERVRETAQVLQNAGANVRTGIYPDIGHRICDEEIVEARKILTELATPPDLSELRRAITTVAGASR